MPTEPSDALARLETMVLSAGTGLPLAAIRAQLAASLDLVVHVARVAGGGRQVVEVAEVQPRGHGRFGVRRLAGAAGRRVPTRSPVSPSLRARRPGVVLSSDAVAVLAALGLALWAGRRAGTAARGARGWGHPETAQPAVSWRLALASLVERSRPGASDDRVAAALPDAVDAIAAAVGAGRSVHDGLTLAAAAAPPRLAVELRTVVARTDRGMAVAESLDRWSGTTAVPGAALVAAAVGLAGDTGGDVAAALGGVADTLRERRALAREIRALSAQARLSAGVIAVAPVGFAALAVTTDGDTAGFLLGSTAGIGCLAIGLGLDLVGWRWMGRIAASVADG